MIKKKLRSFTKPNRLRINLIKVLFLYTSSFKLGGDVSIATGPVGIGASARGVTADMLSFAISEGVYGGLSLDGSVIGTRDKANYAYYGEAVRPVDIIVAQKVKNPQSDKLRDAVEKVRGAVQRVDDPHRVALAVGAALLGEEGVVGVDALDFPYNFRLAGAVDLAHVIVPGLAVHGYGVDPVQFASHQFTGAASGADGDVHGGLGHGERRWAGKRQRIAEARESWGRAWAASAGC